MAKFETKNIRNVALLGHSGSGKTSLAEAMLYLTGETDRLGTPAQGNTVCDYDPEEIARKISISTAVAPAVWKNVKINLLDTPGALDFVGEVYEGVRAADSAIILVDGKSGIEVGTELAWENVEAAGIPRAFFINKFDDPEARFGRVLDSLHDKFGTKICPLTIPMVKGNDVIGIIDLIDQKAHVFDASGKHSTVEIDADSADAVSKYRDMLMEACAGTSDDLMMKFFDGEEITHDEAVQAVHDGIVSGEIVPVFCGAASKFWGVWTLLDKLAESFPAHSAKGKEPTEDGEGAEIKEAGDPTIFVFKTVYDAFVGRMSYFKVITGTVKTDMALLNATTGDTEKLGHLYTIKGKKQTEVDELACGDIGVLAKLVNTNTNDTLGTETQYKKTKFPTPYLCRNIITSGKGEGKIMDATTKMADEDKTYRFENDAETQKLQVYALGDTHLSVLAARLKTRFGVDVEFEKPEVVYREQISKPADVEGKHKKQNGGSGQYGHVKMRFALAESEGLEFTVSVVGGTVPKNFNPAVEKGIEDSMKKGLYGYPVVRLAADLYDGSYHPVDSDELSFKMAASLAYKAALEKSGTTLLEPVGDLFVTIPDDMVGDVMGDLNKHRAQVLGMEPAAAKKGYTVISAACPKQELADYPITLRAMTQGKGSFEYTVTGLAQLPREMAEKVPKKTN